MKNKQIEYQMTLYAWLGIFLILGILTQIN